MNVFLWIAKAAQQGLFNLPHQPGPRRRKSGKLVPKRTTVTRGGKTFQQTVWVDPTPETAKPKQAKVETKPDLPPLLQMIAEAGKAKPKPVATKPAQGGLFNAPAEAPKKPEQGGLFGSSGLKEELERTKEKDQTEVKQAKPAPPKAEPSQPVAATFMEMSKRARELAQAIGESSGRSPFHQNELNGFRLEVMESGLVIVKDGKLIPTPEFRQFAMRRGQSIRTQEINKLVEDARGGPKPAPAEPKKVEPAPTHRVGDRVNVTKDFSLNPGLSDPKVRTESGTVARVERSEDGKPTYLVQLEGGRNAWVTDKELKEPERATQLAKKQYKAAETSVAKLLRDLKLESRVLDPQDDDWHLTLQNSPWLDLVMERHGDKIYLTHYLPVDERTGYDRVHDGEMVYRVSPSGHLTLTETAVQNPFKGGEMRGRSRQFATMFARNLNAQGFGKAKIGEEPKEASEAPAQREDSPEEAKKRAALVAMVGSVNSSYFAKRLGDPKMLWADIEPVIAFVQERINAMHPEKLSELEADGKGVGTLIHEFLPDYKKPEQISEAPAPNGDKEASEVPAADETKPLKLLERARLRKGELKVGDTKSENGVTYQLNDNHRWAKVGDEAPSAETAKPDAKATPPYPHEVAEYLNKLNQSYQYVKESRYAQAYAAHVFESREKPAPWKFGFDPDNKRPNTIRQKIDEHAPPEPSPADIDSHRWERVEEAKVEAVPAEDAPAASPHLPATPSSVTSYLDRLADPKKKRYAQAYADYRLKGGEKPYGDDYGVSAKQLGDVQKKVDRYMAQEPPSDGAGSARTVTREQWDKTSDDYKSVIAGKPFTLAYEEGRGTVLAPVHIQDAPPPPPAEKARMVDEAVQTADKKAAALEYGGDFASVLANMPTFGFEAVQPRPTKGNRKKANAAALALADKLEAEQRPPTPEEREVLARYTGEGGLDEGDINAHYTPTKVAAGMWHLLARAGFKGGRVLEPSMGAGVFVETAPKNAAMTGVEYSDDTGRVATLLHPNARVVGGTPFEEYNTTSDDAPYDAVIANPPYGLRGSTAGIDKVDTKQAERYFIETSLDRLKDGGLAAFLINGGPIEQAGARDWRAQILARAEILGTYQLPGTTFKESNSGVPPVVVLLKKRPHEVGGTLARLVERHGEDVLKGAGVHREDFLAGDTLNAPQNMFGEWDGESRTFSHYKDIKGELNDELLTRFANASMHAEAGTVATAQDLQSKLANVSQDEISSALAYAQSKRSPIPEGTISKDGLYIMRNHRWHSLGGEDPAAAQAVGLADELERYMRVRQTDPHAAEVLRLGLTNRVTNFVEEHGDPNLHAGLKALTKKHNKLGHLLAAVEEGELASHLSEEVKGLDEGATVNQRSPHALSNHLYRRGALTPKSLAERWLADGERFASEDEARKFLLEHYSVDGSGAFVPDEDFYRGNVTDKRARLDEQIAEATAAGDEALARKLDAQKAHLRELLPEKSIEDVSVTPRDKWVPINAVEAFVEQVLHRGFDYTVTLKNGVYYVHRATGGYLPSDIEDFQRYMNHSTVTEAVRGQKDKNKGEIEAERKAAIERAKRLEEGFASQFSSWVAASDYREGVERAYNDKINNFIKGSYSDLPLNIPDWQGPPLHGYQNESVRQMAEQGSGIMALDVGLGKTFAGCALLAKLQSEGRARKAAIIAPKSLMKNWRSNIDATIPGKKILIIGESQDKNGKWRDDNTKDVAKKLVQAATGDWDAVVISKDWFGSIPVRPENFKRMVMSEVENKRASELRGETVPDENDDEDDGYGSGKKRQAYVGVNRRGGKTARDMVMEETKAQQKAQDKLFKHMVTPLFFEDMGFDALMVDESHMYKNLHSAPTTFGKKPKFMGGSAESKRAQDFLHKSRLLREKTGGEGIYFLTATPTKNSPLEVFNMLKHVTNAFEDMGIPTVDDFVTRFCDIGTAWVPNPAGELESVPAVTGFKNMGELRNIMGRFIDRRTAQEVGLKIPNREDKDALFELHDEVKPIYAMLAAQAKAAASKRDAKGDEHLFAYFAQMRQLTLDPALFNEDLAHLPNPRFERAGEIAKKAIDEGGKTVMFMDMGQESMLGGDVADEPGEEGAATMNAYDRLVNHLVRSGVPREKIAVATSKTMKSSAERGEVEDKFNSGELQVVIGSTPVIGEGFNLQKGTTDMVHLDTPWDPGTYWQRLGRAVRQGNPQENVRNHVLLAQGSFDGLTYTSMLGKRGWTQQLWDSSEDRVSNDGSNSFEEIAAMLSNDPEKAREKMAAQKLELEKKAKTARVTSAMRGVGTLGRKRAALDASVERLANAEKKFKDVELKLQNEPDPVRRARYEADAAHVGDLRDTYKERVASMTQQVEATLRTLSNDEDVPAEWLGAAAGSAPLLVDDGGRAYTKGGTFLMPRPNGEPPQLYQVDSVDHTKQTVQAKPAIPNARYETDFRDFKVSDLAQTHTHLPHTNDDAYGASLEHYVQKSGLDALKEIHPELAHKHADKLQTALARSKPVHAYVVGRDGRITYRHQDHVDDALEEGERYLLNTPKDQNLFSAQYPDGVEHQRGLPFKAEAERVHNANDPYNRSWRYKPMMDAQYVVKAPSLVLLASAPLPTFAKAVPPHLTPKVVIRRDGVKQTYHVNPATSPHAEVAVVNAGPGKIGVAFVYDPAFVKKVKAVGGGRYNGTEKRWDFPASAFPKLEQALGHLALTENAVKTLQNAGFAIHEGGGAERDESKDPATLYKRAAEGLELPDLSGSPKQVSWALDIRTSFLESAAALINGQEEDDEAKVGLMREVVEHAGTAGSARWWIDHRDARTVALMEHLRSHAEKEDTTPQTPPVETLPEGDDGFPAVTYAFKTDAAAKLAPEQVVDATRVLGMHAHGARGMVLANGTGTGKTYVYGAAIKEWQAGGKKVLLFVPNKDTKAQTEEVLRFLGVPESAATVATYPELSSGKAFDPHDVVIFDEAHKVKNMFGVSRSKRAQAALNVVKGAGFTLYATATPFEHPAETKYLAFSGLMPKGTNFDDWITGYGIDIQRGYNNSKEYHFTGTPEDLKRLNADLRRRGFLTKRVFEPPAGMVESESPGVEVSPRYAELMGQIEERIESAIDAGNLPKGLGRAQKTMLLRGVLERAKVEASLPVIRKELEAGRSVAVFTQYRAEKELGGDLVDELEDGSLSAELKRALSGLDVILPSSTGMIADAFGSLEGGVALYTGAQTEKQLERAKEDFKAGKQKLLVLTGAKGGTGLSFHDTVGDRPTSQVVVTLPWSATELDQMLGRVVRKGLASKTRILMPVSQASFERKLASIISARMQVMGLAARGGETGVSQEALDAFEHGYARAKAGGLEEILKGVPEVQAATPTPALEAALPLDMFGNAVPQKQAKKTKPAPPFAGGGAKKDVKGYAPMKRRYLKRDGTSYTKTVYVRADRAKTPTRGSRPTRSVQQLSLFDMPARERPRGGVQGSLFAKAPTLALYVSAPLPTFAKAHASGYPLQGRLKWVGLDISVENRAGSVRAGADANGKKWRTKMLYPYGYLRKTEGVDGDHLDCFVGPDEDALTVYIVHQLEPSTGAFDEDKVMLNFRSADEAKRAYLAHYDTPKVFGGMSEMHAADFRALVASGKLKGHVVMGAPRKRAGKRELNKLLEIAKRHSTSAGFQIHVGGERG